MRHLSWFSVFALITIVTASLGPCAVAAEDFTYYHENVLGTSLELCVTAQNQEAARRAENRVLNEIDRLATIFSGYERESEFSRWQAAPKGPVKVSPELYDVFVASEYWKGRSGGAFDPGVEVLSRLWAQCAKLGRLPIGDEMTRALTLLKSPAWRLGPAPLAVERLSDCPLSFNGIAKGYIVERACDKALEEACEISGLLVNLGGDLRVRGAAARTVGIAAPWADSEGSEPFTYIDVKNKSVATSGKSQRGFSINGKWYSHVFDPRSGQPVERVSSVTVIADRGADADALAKICGVLDPDDSVRFVQSLPGVECLILTSNGRSVTSAGWRRWERPRPPMHVLAQAAKQDPAPAAPKAKTDPKKDTPKAVTRPEWDKDFELAVNVEINRPESEKGRYRRPFVAIWIEDEDGKQVRTLALWVSMGGSGPFQWLPDLKHWYKSEEDRKQVERQDIFFTVSRPTRPPGKYKVVGTAKTITANRSAAATIRFLIDAAREHGTYQSIRQPVSLTNKPFSEDLKGNVEIRSASIEYRRKAAAK